LSGLGSPNSLWYGSSVLGHTIVPRDYYELPTVWLPVAFYTIAYEANLSETSLRRLLKFIAAPIFLICFYACAQFAKLNVAYKLNPYYSGGLHIDRALEYGGRVYSTMGNPNVLAQLMTWSIVAFSMAAIFRVGSRVRNLAMSFLCLSTLVMTGSRFGFVTTGIGLLLVFVLSASSRRPLGIQMSVVFLLLVVFAWAFQTLGTINQPTLQRIESLRNPLEVDSFRARIDDLWRDAAEDFARSPVVGHGPAKDIFGGIVTDSEYWDVLKEFGIVGFVCYLGFYLVPLRLMWKGLRASRRAGPFLEHHMPATVWCLRLGIIMVITALVMSIAMTTFYNQLLQAFLWMWMGLAVRSAKTIFDSMLRPQQCIAELTVREVE
jgi:O-antigen ligase